MNEFLETLVTTVTAPLVELIFSVITIVLAAITTRIFNAVRKRFDIEADEREFDVIYKDISGVVKAINQSIVDDIKAKSADGKLTDVEKDDILKTAKDAICSTLTTSQITYINNKYGSFEDAITILIHQVLFDIKHDKNNNTTTNNQSYSKTESIYANGFSTTDTPVALYNNHDNGELSDSINYDDDDDE